MKKQTKTKKKLVDNGCFVALPPWKTAKNKHDAYKKGHDAGELEMRRMFDNEAEQKKKERAEREYTVRLNALERITQSGAHITEAMAKALLSYDNNL